MFRYTIVALVLWATVTNTTAIEDFNVTKTPKHKGLVPYTNNNGTNVFITAELMTKLNHELDAWHWKPWLRTRTETYNNVLREIDCSDVSSAESFPDSIFTDDQLQNGAFMLYVLFGVYSFTLLAIVCNDFFIPCVELICEDLKIPQDVAAATFMSVATSCPEFFVNVISTFLTQSDMGIGTIVGSAIFNLLGVAAVGGLAAVMPIKIKRRPVTRDVLIYMFNVGVLVGIVWDGQVDWYEALILGVLYILYFFIMFNSVRLFALYDKMLGRHHPVPIKINVISPSAGSVTTLHGVDNMGWCGEEDFQQTTVPRTNDNSRVTVVEGGVNNNGPCVNDANQDENVPRDCIFRFPKEKSIWYKIWWLYVWPLKLVLGITIPSPVTFRKFYPFAFFMCIIWIGVNSYFVSWSMSVIGDTFFIPDSVMGMTFLAFGGCLPEACSIFIMSRRGEGGIGVSNALGANSLAILFALGVPWLIKTVTATAQGAEVTVVYINSAGIDFVVGSLLVAACLLWIGLFLGKFKLRKSLGIVFLVLYVIFITFAILVEMGIIFDRGIAFC